MIIFLKLLLLNLLLIIISVHFQTGLCLETDYLNTTLVLRDSDTIISSDNKFTLGFFNPNTTTRRYLGIWYSVSPSAVTWVANKDRPLNDTSGTATISSDGNIVIINGDREVIWSSNVSTPTNTTAQLQDSGNLVLIDISTGITLWESHKHPGNAFLPMMRLTYNTRTRERVVINSWKTPHDPSTGNFSVGVITDSIPQSFIWNNGLPHWRSGPWNGRVFTGVAGVYLIYANNFYVGTDGDDVYISRSYPQDLLLRTYLDTDGTFIESAWNNQTNEWIPQWEAPNTECDKYNKCGPFGLCDDQGKPICSCLRGYEPRNKVEWDRGNWIEGCVRKTAFECEGNASGKSREDGFTKLKFIKLPDFIMLWSIVNENECRQSCLRNCSCLSYAFDPGMGCMYWRNTLIDVQKLLDNGTGMDFYVRVPYSELDKSNDRKVVIIVLVVVCSLAALVCLILSWRLRLCSRIKGEPMVEVEERRSDMDGVDIQELPLYKFELLASSTNNFDERNKLGVGGFGPVYQGKLENGQEIAVKRLSALSGQGLEEFMNEVLVISKLQHRNLVRLLGCCVERGEKMLIYEYMRNRSLDVFLFDRSQYILDWSKRFNIIEGIGRGLLYLHRDSRLRIIHRDLKPSNILLDDDWYPKISDFGMAKIFQGNQDQDNTQRVMGTYGYMAPEYGMRGTFSEKSDVFSFGVLMLEIISGRKNARFHHHELSIGLLGYAWKLWNEDNPVEFIDERISNQNVSDEIMRCLWIGLLCVQESPQTRPTISTILSMLSREIVDLPTPNHPGFIDKWSHVVNYNTANKITVTLIEGR